MHVKRSGNRFFYSKSAESIVITYIIRTYIPGNISYQTKKSITDLIRPMWHW